jgi:SAM-dependent methyltransferase
MDEYTERTKEHLESRFARTDEGGVYLAHQPIYGFRRGHTEGSALRKYTITFQVMRALSHLRFETLVDVGGAEGYKAALAREIFGADVKNCDLSGEACKRATEIFGIDGEPVDVQNLPFEDGQFDVALCSQTLEHVPDVERATRELIRVSSKATVITVPHQPRKPIERNIREGTPHGHVHSMDLRSFDFALSEVSRIVARRIVSGLLRIPRALVDADAGRRARSYPRLFSDAYSVLVPLMRKVLDERAASALMLADGVMCELVPVYDAMLFILLKDESCYSGRSAMAVSPRLIIDFAAPLHYLGGRRGRVS